MLIYTHINAIATDLILNFNLIGLFKISYHTQYNTTINLKTLLAKHLKIMIKECI